MSNLAALLARVEAAMGADRELDLDIARALVPDVICLRQRVDPATGERKAGDNEEFVYWEYTASLDAAIALCERVLPGCMWCVGVMDMEPFARLVPTNGRGDYVGSQEYTAFHDSGHTLALLAALLRAKIAEMI